MFINGAKFAYMSYVSGKGGTLIIFGGKIKTMAPMSPALINALIKMPYR